MRSHGNERNFRKKRAPDGVLVINIEKRKDMPQKITSNIERIGFIKNHPELTNAQLAEIMGISIGSVINMKKNKNFNKMAPWTEEQLLFLKENTDKSRKWLYDNMPGKKHPLSSIISKIFEMGLCKQTCDRWTDEQIRFIKDHKDKTLQWISDNMPGNKKTATAISQRRNIIKKEETDYENEKRVIVKWTDEQVKFLKENEDMSNPWISKNMPEPKKDVSSIRQKRLSLFGRTTSTAIPWSEDEIQFILDNMDKPDMWLTENKPGPKRNLSAIKSKKRNLKRKTTNKDGDND